MSRFDIHNHTFYSNLRLLDATCRPKALVDRAIELGLAGIAITDHESLSAHIELNKLQEEYKEKYPDFKIVLGNEIYLTDTRDSGQKYYHFILLALDDIGHKMLRELSSNAWINSYFDKGMERVPTLKSEVEQCLLKYGKNHLHASTACIGGELPSTMLKMMEAEKIENTEGVKEHHQHIVDFILWCQEVFGKENFTLEVAPSTYPEQIAVNKRMASIAKAFDLNICVGSDSHYLTKEDRYVHAAFLNSKDGERETDDFYGFTYLQTDDEIKEHLKDTGLDVDKLFENSLKILDKCKYYSLRHNQRIPEVEVYDYPKQKKDLPQPTLNKLYESDNIQERYWVNYCMDKLKEKNLYNDEYINRLEYEADIMKDIGEKLDTCVFSYPIFLKHYLGIAWDVGSPVGVARGSGGAGLNHYLMDITQIDPIINDLPYWRFLNKARVELPDIDFDLAPSKRPLFFEEIRKDRGPLGLVQVCTFSTVTTKAAIKIACRGYRSKDYPSGIDLEEAEYLSSLVPVERGFVYPIKDILYGNKEKDRKPIRSFINTVEQYEGLKEILLGIEGLVVARSIHASGIVFFGEDPYERSCFMKAKDGSIITQWSLHDQEAAGETKYDALLVEELDIFAQCIKMLQEHNKIEPELTLRQAYNKYIHPDVLPLDDDKLWDAIDKTDILALFQLNTEVGGNIVRQLLPRNLSELTACNALMRLMGEGTERPADKYARFKKDISLWYKEMNNCGLTEEEQKALEKYCLSEYGVPSSQESMMEIVMDKDICGFSLGESNSLRKIVAKKQMDKISLAKEKIINTAKSPQLGNYIWELIKLQMGYSFSKIHGFAYSLIACQAAYLATYFPRVYWNTAYLRVTSGLEEDAATSYEKVAKAVGDMKNAGIEVKLIDINKSQYMFEPDEQNNAILYGLKALNGAGGDIIQEIVSNRPYNSFQDFQEKVSVNKTVIISLIKGGAFDCFKPRIEQMEEYLRQVSEPKKRLTMQNFNGLVERNLLPSQFDFQKRLFVFNKALKANKKYKDYFIIDYNYYNFFEEFFDIDDLVPVNDTLGIKQTLWKKRYDAAMLPAKNYIKENQEELLNKFNDTLFKEQWDKYATGNLSSWEMDSLGFYYHEHELINVNQDIYNIVSYNKLPDNPVVERTFRRNGRNIPIFKTYRIMGTVVGKNNTKSTVNLLTTDSGVVTVKMNREHFAEFNRRISSPDEKGINRVREKGWFQKGTLLVFNGFRRSGMFVAKTYKKNNSHRLYKITKVKDNGTLEMSYLRWGESDE